MEKLKFNWSEFTGSLGDLGTLVPIFILLTAVNGLNPTVTLTLVGLFYLSSAFYFRLPMPVQPLKALAALAIISRVSPAVISAAGILMGIILLFLAVTGWVNFLSAVFNRPVIRGLQLGVGLMLIRTSWSLITGQVNMSPSLPVPAYPVQGFNLVLPGLDDFTRAFFLLVIPQIPLTLGNAIVSTKDIARRYFGPEAGKVTEHSLAVSMGLANVLSGLAGGMPMCHGSGGLTAHYSFGARTGGAGLIMGLFCLGLSVIFGVRVGQILKLIPYSLLGIMLAYVGFKHALLVKDLRDRKEIILTLGIGMVALLTQNLALACVLGIIFRFLPSRILVANSN